MVAVTLTPNGVALAGRYAAPESAIAIPRVLNVLIIFSTSCPAHPTIKGPLFPADHSAMYYTFEVLRVWTCVSRCIAVAAARIKDEPPFHTNLTRNRFSRAVPGSTHIALDRLRRLRERAA